MQTPKRLQNLPAMHHINGFPCVCAHNQQKQEPWSLAGGGENVTIKTPFSASLTGPSASIELNMNAVPKTVYKYAWRSLAPSHLLYLTRWHARWQPWETKDTAFLMPSKTVSWVPQNEMHPCLIVRLLCIAQRFRQRKGVGWYLANNEPHAFLNNTPSTRCVVWNYFF